ncbi:hypothetical protein [Paenibacillus agaridevorans]|uniref:hypothetical protein n=1 Tax=Paenibacillus agaridevorans TaxID=171404 RepID=UPI001BE45C2E|nr:hypothetical protein [Paenibacillus agaridevorans]
MAFQRKSRLELLSAGSGKAVVYLEKMHFGSYVIKFYWEGEVLGLCTLEAWITRNGELSDLLALAEEWLDTYQDGDPEKAVADRYHIANPNGAWGVPERKEFYLG